MKNRIEHICTDDEKYSIYRIELDEGSYIKIFEPGVPFWDNGETDFGLDHPWIKASECMEDEIKVAKYLFNELWFSENGCTTFIPVENVCEDLEINENKLAKILRSFSEQHINFFAEGVLEWEDDSDEIGIFYDFLEYFNVDADGFNMFDEKGDL